jgi:hypothetical protein
LLRQKLRDGELRMLCNGEVYDLYIPPVVRKGHYDGPAIVTWMRDYTCRILVGTFITKFRKKREAGTKMNLSEIKC